MLIQSAQPSLYRDTRLLMGTECEIQIYDADRDHAREAARAAFDEMARVDRLLSNYIADSELSVMNREAARAPAHVSAELFVFVTRSREFYDSTLHTFDPTIGPLVRAWGFFGSHPVRPDAATIAAARAKTGFEHVRLDATAQSIFYTVSGMEFDPGGIGKGYAADHAADALRHHGITSALISAGGSTFVAIGHPPDRDGWRIAISDPLDRARPYGYVMLRDASLSTSGVSEQSVREGPRRYAHIFDPRRGEPMEGMCQATVVAKTGIESDALSKPAFILSREQVEANFHPRPEVHALRIEGDCGAHATRWTTPWSAAVFR